MNDENKYEPYDYGRVMGQEPEPEDVKEDFAEETTESQEVPPLYNYNYEYRDEKQSNEQKQWWFLRTFNEEGEKFIDFINIPEQITLSTQDSYQKLFNDSSILVTDYSSVFFDFAYLKKPVIYYQPDEDYHYDESYFDFETMGFGDVIKDEDDLIGKINEFMHNGSQMDDKYCERVDNFFKYTDQNNCQRVYKWIKEH